MNETAEWVAAAPWAARGTRSQMSITWKIPLVLVGLLVAASMALLAAAYREVRTSVRGAAEERMLSSAAVMADLFAEEELRLVRRARALAGHPDIRAAFQRTGRPWRIDAEILGHDRLLIAADVRLPDGTVLHRWGPAAERLDIVPVNAMAAARTRSDSAAVGNFRALGDSVVFATVAVVADEGRLLGYLVQWRRSALTRREGLRFNRLAGAGTTVLVGSPGHAWGNLVDLAAAPPLEAVQEDVLQRYLRDGETHVAVAAAVPRTPWYVLLEVPETVLLAPERRFARRMVPVALVVILASLLAGWWHGRRIASRLRGLTSAAEAMAHRDYTHRVREQGEAELVKLAATFNLMAAKVEDEIEARERSEEQWRLLFAANPHPMWVYDKDTLRILAANDAAVDMYDYSDDEFLSLTIEDLRPPEEIPRLRELLKNQRNALAKAGSWRHRRKDGSMFDVEVTSHELEFGGRAARLVLATDVTVRQRLEGELRQAQKMEAVGRLSAGIAHDFNNVLAAVMNHAELLKEDLAGDPRASDADAIINATMSARSLTRQLLSFSRPQSIAPTVIDPDECIRSLLRIFERSLGSRIQIVTRLAGGPLRVTIDAGQFEQVMMNLVVNARDAMPEGGRLTIESRVDQLDDDSAMLFQLPPGSYVSISVADTGTGMDAATRALIFEPYFTTKEQGKGTGLGLSTVYGIVKQAGGHVTVYSEPGHGTTFRIFLPSAGEPVTEPAAEPVAAGALSQPGGQTILLADDDASVRGAIATILQRQGYQVLEASRASEAIELATRHRGPVDLVISDVMMPGQNGPALVQQLRALRPNIAALLISGLAGDGNGTQQAGDVQFLEKPFTAAALTTRVRELLQR